MVGILATAMLLFCELRDEHLVSPKYEQSCQIGSGPTNLIQIYSKCDQIKTILILGVKDKIKHSWWTRPISISKFWPIRKLRVESRDGRFGSKVGQIGLQIGQIRAFFRSDFSTFGSMSQTYHPWLKESQQVRLEEELYLDSLDRSTDSASATFKTWEVSSVRALTTNCVVSMATNCVIPSSLVINFLFPFFKVFHHSQPLW